MARRPAASQRHAAAVPLGFPLLLAVSCCLQAEAFAFGGQQTAVCGCLSHAGSRVLQPVSAAAPPLATSSRQQAFAAGLEAAGDAGGEAGGQMMLVSLEGGLWGCVWGGDLIVSRDPPGRRQLADS